MTKLLKDIFLLLIISTVLGILAQFILPNGIGLKTEIMVLGDDVTGVEVAAIAINPTGEEDTATNIELQQVYEAFLNGTAILLDARSPEEYAKGHIQGAVNIPVHAFLDSLTYLENLGMDTHIITYCDGEDCNASIDLAADIKMMGFTKVNFFFGGSLEWESAGYPMEGSE